MPDSLFVQSEDVPAGDRQVYSTAFGIAGYEHVTHP